MDVDEVVQRSGGLAWAMWIEDEKLTYEFVTQ